MNDFWVSVIATILSAMIFSFLLYILNTRVWGVFVPIQRDLAKLSKTTRRILSAVGYLLAISISLLFEYNLDISDVGDGIILGCMLAIIETCSRNDSKENDIERRKEY